MKNISVIFNVVLLILIAILFYLHFSKPINNTTNTKIPNKDTTGAAHNSFVIAYVDIDSLQTHYGYFREKKEELEKKQSAIQNELSNNSQKIQNEVTELRKKASTMTQEEGNAAQQKIMKEQQQLQQKEQDLRQQFMDQQSQFQEDLENKLNAFLTDYNKDKGYAYILSYSKGLSNILYKDNAYDITQDVIDGLNAIREKKSK